jgi:hypothetical protein
MNVEALQKMTVAELREEARKLDDVKGIASMKKDDLVKLLAGSASMPRKQSKGGGLNLPVLKERIRALKAKRAAALAHGQKAKVTEFNSDLRVLRRKMRKAARRRRRKSS